jgi:hypothetical protein
MRSLSRLGWVVGLVVLVAGAVSGCTGSDTAGTASSPAASGPGASRPTASAASSSSPSTDAEPSPTATVTPAPGQECEPGSHPDCSDATGTEGDSWRIIAGYADCVAGWGAEEAYGLCTDLDGDDQAGYADAG